MGAAPKYKHQFKKEPAEQQEVQEQKKQIDAYKKKIEQLLKDPDNARKAADIIKEILKSSK